MSAGFLCYCMARQQHSRAARDASAGAVAHLDERTAGSTVAPRKHLCCTFCTTVTNRLPALG